jgi:hypothetical protein
MKKKCYIFGFVCQPGKFIVVVLKNEESIHGKNLVVTVASH